jgi:hypothetical protein
MTKVINTITRYVIYRYYLKEKKFIVEIYHKNRKFKIWYTELKNFNILYQNIKHQVDITSTEMTVQVSS